MANDPEILPTGISRLAVNAVVVTTVLTFLAILLAFLRFKLRERGAFGGDDYVLMVALLFLVLQLIGGYMRGEGWGMADLAQHPERITWLLKMIYWPELGYTIVVVLIKTSILLSYKRIFGHVTQTKYHIYILLGLSWGWGIAVFFACVFQCSPIKKAWMPEIPGHCIKTIPFLWGNSISNFIIDWLILAVPIKPVLKLHLPPTQKVLVALSFLCGALACIASTIRSAMTASFDPSNIGISDYHASIWVFAEPPLATISCCLPFMTRLFGAKVVKGLRNMTNRATKGSTNNSYGNTPSNNSTALTGKFETSQAIRVPSTDGREDLLPPPSQIRKVTVTTVKSRELRNEEHEMGSYRSVAAPAKSLPKSISTTSLV
ncbi:hypothetical protein N0V90_002086 [Kalmusia sp. IMI 367209]|nr:hypothetical protein N0V90_002086 [Kalmusia sp. IMI 367209]